MIASVFRKSTPINYILVLVATIFFYFFYQMQHGLASQTVENLIKTGLGFALVLSSLFLTNFIIKKNGLSKDSTYNVFFYLLFVLFFPSVLENETLLLSNFFVLLGMRRLVSMQTLKMPKEKIFDASLWIFLAAIFHFWSILFLLVVYISIIFHVSRDYRNWLLPFISFFATVILFLFAAFLFDKSWISTLLESSIIDLRITYFETTYQNISFSIYATVILFFVVSFLLTLSNRSMLLKSSYKKIVAWFFIALIVFALSPQKSNDILVFTFAPLAMIATFYIESVRINWQKEVVVYFLMALSLFTYFSQL